MWDGNRISYFSRGQLMLFSKYWSNSSFSAVELSIVLIYCKRIENESIQMMLT